MSPLPKAKPANSLGMLDTGPAETHIDSSPAEISWQRDLAGAIREPQQLLAALDLRESQLPELSEDATGPFPLLVPRSYVARMEPGNAADPLLQQVLPQQAELLDTAGFEADAVGDEQSRVAPGLLQKYHGRALMIAAGSCAVHCRYCFRREYPYSAEPHTMADWQPALEYIRDDPSLTEVILSGGDPLMLPDARLRHLVDEIDDISHVERVRIHTRLPVVLPSRVTEELLTTLSTGRSQVIFVIHANHANEIAADCKAALRQVVAAGIPALNQTVLLKGINNNCTALEALSRALVNVGVMPYYLHQLDHVTGTAHFEVDDMAARQLIADLQSRLPGYAVPRLVREIAGRQSKTPVDLRDACYD